MAPKHTQTHQNTHTYTKPARIMSLFGRYVRGIWDGPKHTHKKTHTYAQTARMMSMFGGHLICHEHISTHTLRLEGKRVMNWGFTTQERKKEGQRQQNTLIRSIEQTSTCSYAAPRGQTRQCHQHTLIRSIEQTSSHEHTSNHRLSREGARADFFLHNA